MVRVDLQREGCLEAVYDSKIGVKCFFGLFRAVKNRVFGLKMRGVVTFRDLLAIE